MPTSTRGLEPISPGSMSMRITFAVPDMRGGCSCANT